MSEMIEQAQRRGRGMRVAAIAAVTLLCLVTATVIGTFLVHGMFAARSGSMSPAVHMGDHVLVSRMFWDGEPERGDVIVCNINYGKNVKADYYLSRIIGLPGERIAMRDGQVIINGKPVERREMEARLMDAGFKQPVPAYEETLPGERKIVVLDAQSGSDFDNSDEVIVPPGRYFVMGDNRDLSFDSRSPDKVGFVSREAIFGKVKMVLFSEGGLSGTGQRVR